jgi:hypothetical protein
MSAEQPRTYDRNAVPDRAFTDAELDAALVAITEPGRLTEAQDIVMRTAPALQHLLAHALQDGGWFEGGHDQAVREAVTAEESGERVSRIQTMLAEEARLGMLVGVAVGFELAQELTRAPGAPGTESTEQED